MYCLFRPVQWSYVLVINSYNSELFSFRYNGQYLRDAFSLDDYNIEANAVVKMVPLTDDQKDVMLLSLV